MPVDSSLGGDENVSSQLPKSDAESDLLKPAIAELLRTIPETWAELNEDALSAIKQRALFLLTAAGMVEQRGWIRSSMANHPAYFELHFQSTGEGGFYRVMEKASAFQYQTWRDAWLAWSECETKGISPFHSERIKPGEWRLTDQGALARGDLRQSDGKEVVDFVLIRKSYGPGYWHRLMLERPLSIEEVQRVEEHIASGRDLADISRPHVSGSGELLSCQKIENPPSTQSVNLTNWAEGASMFAEAFAKALGPAFCALNASQPTGTEPRNPVPQKSEAPIGRPTTAERDAELLKRWEAEGHLYGSKAAFGRAMKPPMEPNTFEKALKRAEADRKKASD